MHLGEGGHAFKAVLHPVTGVHYFFWPCNWGRVFKLGVFCRFYVLMGIYYSCLYINRPFEQLPQPDKILSNQTDPILFNSKAQDRTPPIPVSAPLRR